MAYSKAKLNSNGDRTSPFFQPFLRGKMSNSCLFRLCYTFHSDTFLFVLPLHRDTKLNENIIPDFPPKWIIGFRKVYEELLHCFLVFPFFSSIWRIQNIWSVFDLLRRNPRWWSPIISSVYEVNLLSRMLDKILCNLMFLWPCIMNWPYKTTNVMHWILFIRQILLLSSTCFEFSL